MKSHDFCESNNIKYGLCQRLFQICQEIISIFNANRKTEQRIGETARLANIFWNGAVSHRCRVTDKRLDTAKALCQCKNLEAAYHLIHISIYPLKLERDHTAKTAHLASG